MRAWVGFVCLCACGGGGGGGSFGASSVEGLTCESMACGGDLVGTWDIAGGCVDATLDDEVFEMCPSATARIDRFDVEGWVRYDADGTGESEVRTVGRTRFTIPQSCLMGFTCAALNNFFAEEVADEEGGFDASCSGSGSCSCVITSDATETESFTWSSEGNTVTTGVFGDTQGYCVESNAALIREVDEGSSLTLLLERRETVVRR